MLCTNFHKIYPNSNNVLILFSATIECGQQPSPLAEAMRYGVLLGGKRIRPFLVYATGRMLGADLNQLDYAAASVEAVHAYSLIHDDLLRWMMIIYVVDNQLAILLLITPPRF